MTNTPITFTNPTTATSGSVSNFKVTHDGTILLDVPGESYLIVGKPPLRTLLRHILLRLIGR